MSHLIGHEGPGSLLSLLKAKGWCNNLGSSSQYGGRGFATFNISVDLTENGINHTDDIVELVFQVRIPLFEARWIYDWTYLYVEFDFLQYINLLNKEGIHKWIFDEQANILATGFRFKDKEEPRKFVAGYVNDIQVDFLFTYLISVIN